MTADYDVNISSKWFKIGLIFLIVVTLVSCKKSTSLNVNETLIKYNLVADVNIGYDLNQTNWNRKGNIYTNKATDSCLIILINKKGDTILTHLDKGIKQWYFSKMVKIRKEYFVIKREINYIERDTTNPYYKPLNEGEGYISYNDVDYPMDSYYRLDSVNKILEPIKLISKSEIAKEIKQNFQIKEHIKILASSNTYTYIAKDTLNDCQAYYELPAKYSPIKRNNQWVLTPSKYSQKYLMGIYKNNITTSNQWLGSTLTKVSIDSLGKNINRYDIFVKTYTKFSCDSQKYNRCYNDFVKLEVILKDKTKKEQKVIEIFTNNTFFEDNRFDIFKYKDGEYFLGILPEIEKEYKETLFRLDTINWKLDCVKKYDKKRDINFVRYRKDRNSLISGNTLGKMNTFLEEYEIVKVKDGWRLITPE